MKSKYIYSKSDFTQAIQQALKDMFGYDLIDFIEEKTIKYLDEYVNLYRFYERNCAGCVDEKTECDVAYGKGKAKDCWEKAKKGELFDCPVRINGTLVFTKEEGIKKIDISDRNEPLYPIIKTVYPKRIKNKRGE